MGRPTKYRDTYPQIAAALCRKGYTDEELADTFGVSRDTLHEWRKLYPDFGSACEESKASANAQVEAAMFKRAMGYDYIETTAEGGVITKVVKKHLAGDVTAQIIWLTNRTSDWKHRQQLEHSGPNGEAIPIGLAASVQIYIPDNGRGEATGDH